MLNQFLGNKAVLVVQFPEIAIQQLSLEFMLNGAGHKTAEFLVTHMLPNPRREFFVHAYRPCEDCHTMMLTADIDNSRQIERAPVSIPPGHHREEGSGQLRDVAQRVRRQPCSRRRRR